ncbi:MAG: LemA family protein [Clostridiaceae bacterium]|nr:LemA family protein [Clostridiaceae bacterium]
MEVVLVLCGIAVVLLVWYISCSNSLKRMVVKIDEGLSGIDVALTKRYDSLTKIMDVAKSYAKHESEVLGEVIRLRSGMTMTEREQAGEAIGRMADRMNILAEAYPQLASSENYRQLQMAAADAEEHLQAARRLYNSNVSVYNQAVVSFPKSIVASNLGMTKKEFFKAEEQKRQDVKLEF